jgi:hypothetical protein
MLSLTKGVYIFDIEADNLLEEATKIHCLSIGKVLKSGELKIVSTTDYEEMRNFFLNKDITKVGHNILRYDTLVVEKLLDIKVPTKNLIDTLPLSWVLYPQLNSHGLEAWGNLLGISKVDISDWHNLTTEEYIHRCEEDVKINHALFMEQRDYLLELYDTEEQALEFVKYSNFKSICVREQEDIGIRFDKERAEKCLLELEGQKAERIQALEKVIPPEDIMATKTVPSPDKMYKKDGSMSKAWQDWLQFRVDYGIPEDWNESKIQYVKGTKPGNPDSPAQIKNWLYGLGWEPCTFNYTRNKDTNEFKGVPQIYNKDTGEVTPSVKKLIEKEPAVELLNLLGKIKHRIGLFTGMLESAKEVEPGHFRLYATISGYANTMRMQHKKPLVNLPKPSLFMGEEIRGCLISDEGSILCGSDLTGIENATRNNYIYAWDSEYVNEMDRPDFDPHCDIALLAGLMSEDDSAWFIETSRKMEREGYHLSKEEEPKYKELKKIRGVAKQINFASVYGCSPKTMSRNTGMPLNFCAKLIDTYWERNWAVKAFSATVKTKVVKGQTWALNPVSKFWYSLRSEKDIFSTINQSTACFIFDRFVLHTRKLKVKIAYQCHDEMLFNLPEGQEDYVRELIDYAIQKVNDELQLNVTIKSASAFGYTYSSCH